jgi:MFS-type transporter involved in bile tolerance (Atg22 family)
MLVNLLGLETLTKSFGLLILFQGIAAIVGAPLAGYIADATGSVDKSFLVAGVLIVLSGLVMFPIKCLQIGQAGERPNMVPYAATPLPIQKTLKLQSSV